MDNINWLEKILAFFTTLFAGIITYLLKEVWKMREQHIETQALLFGHKHNNSSSIVARLDKLEKKIDHMESLLISIATKLKIDANNKQDNSDT